MNTYDKDFIYTFNEYYPLERYIIKNPKPINYLFDDALLTEIFIPATEIKPIMNSDGEFSGRWTNINNDEIYVKIQGKAGTMRFSYFDFSESIREEIRHIFYEDFGQYEWECLYVEHEDEADNENLSKVLCEQKKLILEQYTLCVIKDDVPEAKLLKNGTLNMSM